MKLIQHIRHPGTRKGTGNKAMSLHRMSKYHFRIPDTFVIPMKVREMYALAPEVTLEKLLREIEEVDTGKHSWAVRSSGETEDIEGHSYAGQFVTVLDVSGTDSIMKAIKKVWASADAVPEGLYREKTEAVRSSSGMSVILQRMIQATWAGVAFSINPVTGRHEMVIEAVQGSGAKLVKGMAKPFRLLWQFNQWKFEEDPGEEILKVLDELRAGMEKLQKVFGGPVDVEWAFNGKELFYLQCRKVSVSEFPTIYSNHISREVLPGMIKPLVWSVNIPLVNGAWIRLLEGMLGTLNIQPDQLSKSFYYRAYFNMGTLGAIFRRMGLPNDALESLMGRKNTSGRSNFRPSLRTFRFLPSILRFLLFNLLFLERNFKRELSLITERTDALVLQMKNINAAAYRQFFNEIHTLASEAAYFNIVIPLTFQISNGILQKKLKKRGIPFERLEFVRDIPELKDFDPNNIISELRQRWLSLPEKLRNSVSDYGALGALRDDPKVRVLEEKMQFLINRFGHFSESGNDFSFATWREDPDFLFQLVCRGEGDNPVSRKHSENNAVPSKGVPRRAYRRAGRFRLYREMISSEYTRCYGLFRVLFLSTGSYFQKKGWIDQPEDVFYLTLDQHNRLLEDLTPREVHDFKRDIHRVKREMKEYTEVILPPVIYGETAPTVHTREKEVWEGIPASPGIFSGELVVVRGYEDFPKKVDGKVLVIPFSDVGWTPLLVRAGAIVSESGGMLSHAAIIARELSIPAITSIDHACNLKDGTRVQVDGYNGTLLLSK